MVPSGRPAGVAVADQVPPASDAGTTDPPTLSVTLLTFGSDVPVTVTALLAFAWLMVLVLAPVTPSEPNGAVQPATGPGTAGLSAPMLNAGPTAAGAPGPPAGTVAISATALVCPRAMSPALRPAKRVVTAPVARLSKLSAPVMIDPPLVPVEKRGSFETIEPRTPVIGAPAASSAVPCMTSSLPTCVGRPTVKFGMGSAVAPPPASPTGTADAPTLMMSPGRMSGVKPVQQSSGSGATMPATLRFETPVPSTLAVPVAIVAPSRVTVMGTAPVG